MVGLNIGLEPPCEAWIRPMAKHPRNPSQPADHSVEAAGQLRVLVVDDHPLFREALKDLLQQEPDLEVCGEAADVRQALEQFQATGADLITMDISLPSGN